MTDALTSAFDIRTLFNTPGPRPAQLRPSDLELNQPTPLIENNMPHHASRINSILDELSDAQSAVSVARTYLGDIKDKLVTAQLAIEDIANDDDSTESSKETAITEVKQLADEIDILAGAASYMNQPLLTGFSQSYTVGFDAEGEEVRSDIDIGNYQIRGDDTLELIEEVTERVGFAGAGGRVAEAYVTETAEDGGPADGDYTIKLTYGETDGTDVTVQLYQDDTLIAEKTEVDLSYNKDNLILDMGVGISLDIARLSSDQTAVADATTEQSLEIETTVGDKLKTASSHITSESDNSVYDLYVLHLQNKIDTVASELRTLEDAEAAYAAQEGGLHSRLGSLGSAIDELEEPQSVDAVIGALHDQFPHGNHPHWNLVQTDILSQTLWGGGR